MANKQKGGYQPKGQGSMANAEQAGMSAQDKSDLYQQGQNWTQAHQEYEEAKAQGNADAMASAQDKMNQAHLNAEAIRGQNGYSGGMDGSEYIGLGQSNLQSQLDSWFQSAQEQQRLEAEYAVSEGVKALERAEEEAQQQFQVQQNINDRDERRALDNQALYMEARGDRGGIGHAQYGEIQAQAMANRQSINTARIKLSTDTARQIADLRARGEFQKADSLLKLTQTYLDKLTSLQQWQAEYKLGQDQFNAQLDHWQQEFELSVGQMTGSYKGQPTYAAQQKDKEMQVQMGLQLLKNGIRPSASQQAAMGMTDVQIDAYLKEYQQNKQFRSYRGSSGYRGSGGRRGSSGSKRPGHSGETMEDMQVQDQEESIVDGWNIYQKVYADGQIKDRPILTQAEAYEVLHNMGYSSGEAKTLARYFEDQVQNGILPAWWEEEGYSQMMRENKSGGEHDWIWVDHLGRLSYNELEAGLKKYRVINGKKEYKILRYLDDVTGATIYELNPKWR